MKPRWRWLPFPLQSAALLTLWLLLVNSVAPAQLLLGALLALALPLWWRQFLPQTTQLHRPLTALRFIGRIMLDIVTANLLVAAQVLAPNRRLRPAFMRLPLELTGDFAITVLASTISLTPGTVSAEVSGDRRSLLIHALHVVDPEAAIAVIKRRYEAPLREIFGC
jgi:multicomponent K+:H+ antiporter subunit E